MSDNHRPGQTHPPLRELVTDAIREGIVTGRYSPGERLYEDRIATELAVSRNPVREALQALAKERFVVLEARRGASVAHIDRDHAQELFEVRGALEGLTASLAAERASDDQMEALLRVASEGTEAARDARHDELPKLNTHFHDLMSIAADNTLLTETLGQLSGVIRWIYASRINLRADESWAEHTAIALAIAEADADRARAAAEAHVAAARAAYLES